YVVPESSLLLARGCPSSNGRTPDPLCSPFSLCSRPALSWFTCLESYPDRMDSDKSPYHSLRREKRRQKRSLANQDDIHGKPTRRVELLLQTWCGAARNAALEFQDQPLRSDSPAMVRVGKRDGIRAFSIHLIPGLAPVDRVIHPAGTYCESG